MSRIHRSGTDVAVVGLGPAGIVLSRVLSDAGLRVTALQPTPPVAGRSPLASPIPTVRHNLAEVALRAAHPPAGADRIGGSKHLAAPQSYRLTPENLHPRSLNAAKAPEALLDWPLAYNELLPYYERVEQLMRVEPRPATAWTTRMHKAAETLGWHPFAAPAAADTDVTHLLTGRTVNILDGTAVKISTSSSGAADGVHYLTGDGELRRVAAGAVVIAAAPIATVRLLLLSGIEVNRLVGQYFMAHNSFTVNGWFPGSDLGRDRAGPASAVAVAQFEAGPDAGVLGGSVLQAAMTGPRTTAWLEGLARPHSWVAGHAAGIGTVWAQPEQLPRAGNRVDLDPRHRDPSGRPVARITFDIDEDDRRRADFLAAPMAQWLRSAGADHTWATPFEAQPLTTHLYGGARMSADPAKGVVDGFGRAHTVPGLVIVGSSTFPSTGGRGPVQTIEALAWRSADRLAEDLGRSPISLT
jgi:gluconate 2-dehydrogenase alpha chain